MAERKCLFGGGILTWEKVESDCCWLAISGGGKGRRGKGKAANTQLGVELTQG